MPIVDFSGVEDTNRLLPEGIYDAKVFDVKLKEGKNGPYYQFSFEITSPEGAGVRVTEICSFSEGALNITWKSLSAILGEPLAKGPFDPEMEMDRFFGRPCKLRIGHQEYQGEQRNDVQSVMKAGASAPTGKAKTKAQGPEF